MKAVHQRSCKADGCSGISFRVLVFFIPGARVLAFSWYARTHTYVLVLFFCFFSPVRIASLRLWGSCAPDESLLRGVVDEDMLRFCTYPTHAERRKGKGENSRGSNEAFSCRLDSVLFHSTPRASYLHMYIHTSLVLALLHTLDACVCSWLLVSAQRKIH